MQTHLLLREHPRALALRPTVLGEAPPAVLVLQKHEQNKATAKLYSPAEFEDSEWRILNSRPVFGCLGLITVQSGYLYIFKELRKLNCNRMFCGYCDRLFLGR